MISCRHCMEIDHNKRRCHQLRKEDAPHQQPNRKRRWHVILISIYLYVCKYIKVNIHQEPNTNMTISHFVSSIVQFLISTYNSFY